MTLRSGFFDSINGDRKYDADDFGGVFDSLMTEGISRGVGTEFSVTPTTGRGIVVGTGRAWFRKKWAYNDAPVPFTLEPADAAQPRIDLVVLDLDLGSTRRDFAFRILKGTAQENPVEPAVINNAQQLQVPLYAVRREANTSTIPASLITKKIGVSPSAPYAAMRLENPQTSPGIMHGATVRGKNLGTSFTEKQRQAIQNGSFEDLYLGDFWVINGYAWRIVSMDYYYHQNGIVPHNSAPGAIEINSNNPHHVVVMPDAPLTRGNMNNDPNKQNAGGYNGADMRMQHLPPMFQTISAAFGSTPLMAWADLWSAGMVDGRISEARWFYGVQMELPSQIQMFGHDLWTPRSRGEVAGPILDTASTTQFALFRIAPSFIRAATFDSNSRTQWLRDPVSTVEWAIVSSAGASARAICNADFGFRPYFCLA